MTTFISLDHSKHLKQSFDELTHQANDLCQCIDDLKTETTCQLGKLEDHFKRVEQLCGSSVVPLYDKDNLYSFIFERLKRFNLPLDKLSKEKQRFKLILENYETTLKEVVAEVAHG